jgi:hypothetical protein
MIDSPGRKEHTMTERTELTVSYLKKLLEEFDDDAVVFVQAAGNNNTVAIVALDPDPEQIDMRAGRFAYEHDIVGHVTKIS